MPFVYYEEPVFTIPRKNWHWISDYDFLYEKLRHLEKRVITLEREHESKEGKTDEPVHTD